MLNVMPVPIQSVRACHAGKKIIHFIIFTFIVFMIFGCQNPISVSGNFTNTNNKMYVYSNHGKIFYLIDYKTFEVVKEIQLPVPDTISLNGMIISTNRDHLFFKAEGQYPLPPFGFAIYDIPKDKLANIFFTEFKGAEPTYFISAQNNIEPGLIFVRFRDLGTYSIYIFEQKTKEFISEEHDFDLDERIFYSPDNQWTVVHKHWSGDIKGSYSELEFYLTSSGLRNLQFILNKDDKNSISIYDFIFSKNHKLFITYQPSDGRSRGIESYFGSYDLETKQLYRSSIKFP